MSNKKLIFEARMRANRFGSATTIGSLLDELADALEAAESPTTVEWGVNVGNYPDGSISVMVATEQDARAFRSRPAVKRNVGPWEVVAP